MMIREWSSRIYRSRIDKNRWVATNIALARKFVLDDDMSAFVSDLSYACLPATSSEKRIRDMLESQRAGARLPFPLTWIEMNMKARIHRAKEYGAFATGYRGPDRVGWLMFRHPQNEHAFLSVHCCSQSMDPKNNDLMIDVPSAAPLAYAWVTDESAIPWPTLHPTSLDEDRVAQWLLGIGAYNKFGNRVGFVHAPYSPKELRSLMANAAAVSSALREQAGDIRSIWAFLSTLNDIPTLRSSVMPTKGHMVGGGYRKFVEHTVLSLRVPQKVNRRSLARQIGRAARRRAHPVRGHWRLDHRILPAALCEHVWKDEEAGNYCTICKGRRLWIAEHQRGDASLGFVLHDYSVQRGDA